jgi:Icc-related predicted phosphoesterase
MELQIASDLHLEFSHRNWQPILEGIKTNADVLCLAGDICYAKQMESVYRWCSDNYRQTAIVFGNHEYYHGHAAYVEETAKNVIAKLPNVYLLNPGFSMPLDNGKRMYGGTLWYPKNDITRFSWDQWSDCFATEGLTLTMLDEHYQKLTQYLFDNVKHGDVVMTHMSPSRKSVAPAFVGNPWNCFFHNDLEELIHITKPALWIHGHTHSHFDYLIGNYPNTTRVICNPLGYKFKEEQSGFDPVLTVNI